VNRAQRFAIAAALAALVAATGARAADALAVIHARAYTLERTEPIEDATILMRGGRIVSVSAGLAPPAGATVIDAKGRIATPGLFAPATQLGLIEVDSVPDTNDASVATGPLGAAFDIEYALNPHSSSLALARADGVTRAVSVPGGSASAPFAGAGALIRLATGKEVLERAHTGIFVEVGGMSAARAGGSRSAQWILLRNALTEARDYGRAHRTGAPRDQLLSHLDAEALQPVLGGRMPLAISAARESDIREAIRLAGDFGLRVIVVGGAEAWRVAPLLASHRIPVILDPFDDYPATFDELGARLDNAALLQRAGVTVAFVTPWVHRSHNAGAAMREAAGLASANGLPWIEALKSVTLNPARIWGIEDRCGTLAPGKDADLVIWDGDPLEPTTAPVAVIIDGESVSLATRQSRLRDRYAPARRLDKWPPAYR
jgi:imidazolonepropionase-like amidohydrolase